MCLLHLWPLGLDFIPEITQTLTNYSEMIHIRHHHGSQSQTFSLLSYAILDFDYDHQSHSYILPSEAHTILWFLTHILL